MMNFHRFLFLSLLGTAYMTPGTEGTTGDCGEDLWETEPETLQSLLPPSLPWNDTRSVSEFVVEDLNDPFVTPFELSNYTETATYEEVTDFFTRLAAESPYVEMKSLVTLANGEELWLITVSGEQKFEPDEMTLPTLFATAAIHPGESECVNAGMMLIRNLVLDPSYSEMLSSINFLFIPVLNIQGYLRQSITGRINQHGPNTSGRRANGSWKNLNRDFGKLDTPEVSAVVGVMNDYNLAFYTDLHSTDGMNYQPDVTWCDNGDSGLSPEIYSWLRSTMQPQLEEFVEGYDHVTSVCYYANDKMDPTAGFYPYFTDGAAYSNNYADARHIPAYLLELHSLKPNKQRVLGGYAFLAGLLKIVGENYDTLQQAIEADRNARVDPVPVAWDYDDPAPMVEWPIFNYSVVTNEVLGIEQIIWTNEPITITAEQSTRSTPLNPPKRPYSYVIPAVWSDVIAVLDKHGVQMEMLTEEISLDVASYDFESTFQFSRIREGRAEMAGEGVPINCTRIYRPRDVVVKTDQTLGTLAVSLLEPSGESSFYLWGFFNSMLTSHEYPENYIMIPLAERMLAEDPDIAAEWESYKSENLGYANETDAVLQWFFRRSAYYDADAYKYPVGILYSEVSLPLTPYDEDPNKDDLANDLETPEEKVVDENEGEVSAVGRDSKNVRSEMDNSGGLALLTNSVGPIATVVLGLLLSFVM